MLMLMNINFFNYIHYSPLNKIINFEENVIKKEKLKEIYQK